jgi:hypothetical protein
MKKKTKGKMKMHKIFAGHEPEALIKMGITAAKEKLKALKFLAGEPVYEVFTAGAKFPECFKKPGKKHLKAEDYISMWLQTYEKGYDQRASKRASKSMGTKADPIINRVLEEALGKSPAEVDTIIEHHRYGMAAENILGLLLEEYVANQTKGNGWHCAWGSTLLDVDFCSKDGDLLQVKNRSNSENNASKRVREGTEIKKWHRIGANDGKMKWEELQKITGVKDLTELGFQKFVLETLKTNPGLFPFEKPKAQTQTRPA